MKAGHDLEDRERIQKKNPKPLYVCNLCNYILKVH